MAFTRKIGAGSGQLRGPLRNRRPDKPGSAVGRTLPRGLPEGPLAGIQEVAAMEGLVPGESGIDGS